MTTERTATDSLTSALRLVEVASDASAIAIAAASRLTDGGKLIDEHQVRCERVAQLATEAQAAGELLAYAERRRDSDEPDEIVEEQAFVFAADVVHRLRSAVEADADGLGIDAENRDALEGPGVREAIHAGLLESRIQALGRRVIEARGAFTAELDDPVANLTRDTARSFARTEVAPIAQEMHRQDHLVPEPLIQKMAGLGLFGCSVPESYGGTEMGLLTMVVLTEELSSVSLVAGSLITRSEILTRALLQGGTEEQRQRWLPPIASGELLVGIAVTEPDVGSDVASVTCRATKGEHNGLVGWFIEGPKAWSTFAGRANILALLARTESRHVARQPRAIALYRSEGALRRTSLRAHAAGRRFDHCHGEPNAGIPGHALVYAGDRPLLCAGGKPGGWRSGYREGVLSPDGRLCGRTASDGGRATGVGQAALEKACNYALDRKQFGRPIADYQLTQHKIGRMSTHVAAGRHLTYAAARAMEQSEQSSMEAAMCKLFASDVAVWVTQEAQLIHGGWGYSEEDPVARYVVDALVLPIFEGVKPILELKVIARQLLAS